MAKSEDIIQLAMQRLVNTGEKDTRPAARRAAIGVVTDLSDVTTASCHTDDELLDLAISAVGEYAAASDRLGAYDQVLAKLDGAGCDRRRAYHILRRLANEVDSMLQRNDAERSGS